MSYAPARPLSRPMEARPSFDAVLTGAVLLLMGIGLVMVLSASGVMAERYHGGTYHFFLRQSLYALLGLGALWACATLPRALFYRLTYVFLGLAILLLALTAFSPLGAKVGGARRWMRLGGFSLQPLEFAKLALVFYLAYFFSQKQEMVRRFSIGFVPPFAVTGLLCLLLLAQPDFGGAAFLLMLLFLMSLVGGTRVVYLGASMLVAASAGALLIMRSPYRMRRWFAFLDPFKDAQDSGYQLVQSLYAFGSGKFLGVGLGAGKQKLHYLPEAHNDFIMAVIGEELGLVGVTVIFALVGVILWRAFSIAVRQEDLRDRFTAYGLTCILALGFLLNLAVVLGTVPPKGVPMPFVSYGGSNLLVCMASVGLLVNMSRERKS